MRQMVGRIGNEPFIVGDIDYTIGRSVARLAIQYRLGLLSEWRCRDCPDHPADFGPTRTRINYHLIIYRPPD